MKVLLPGKCSFSRAEREGAGGRPRAGKRGPAQHRAASAAPRSPRPDPAAAVRAPGRARGLGPGAAAPASATRWRPKAAPPASAACDPFRSRRSWTPISEQGPRVRAVVRAGRDAGVAEEPRSRGPGAPPGKEAGAFASPLRLPHLQTGVPRGGAGGAPTPESLRPRSSAGPHDPPTSPLPSCTSLHLKLMDPPYTVRPVRTRSQAPTLPATQPAACGRPVPTSPRVRQTDPRAGVRPSFL